MKIFRSTIAVLTALLGMIHVGFTPVFYHDYNLGVLWFAGSGLTLVFLGVANLLLIGRSETWVRCLGLLANALGLTFVTLLAMMLKQPQAYVGLVLVLILFVSGLKRTPAQINPA